MKVIELYWMHYKCSIPIAMCWGSRDTYCVRQSSTIQQSSNNVFCTWVYVMYACVNFSLSHIPPPSFTFTVSQWGNVEATSGAAVELGPECSGAAWAHITTTEGVDLLLQGRAGLLVWFPVFRSVPRYSWTAVSGRWWSVGAVKLSAMT